jgi:uncharacterized protein YukE
MSDMSNIDSDKIAASANQLDGVVDRMRNSVGKFGEVIENLDKVWVSEVKGEFMKSYRSDMDAMQEMLSQLREINSMLKETAADFDKTENEIMGNVRALK